MKKLLIIFGFVLILGLLATPAFSVTAIEFDFDEDGFFDDEWWLTQPGETLNVDVYLTGYNLPTDLLLVDHYSFSYDGTKLSENTCIMEVPPWQTSGFCGCDDDQDACWAEVINWSGVAPSPKIKLLRWVFNAIGGDSQIQNTVEDAYCDMDWTCYYIDVASVATIHGPCGVAITPYTSSKDSGETIQFSASPHGEACTNPEEYEWAVTSECGSVIDLDTGLYTAGCLVGSTSSDDTIKATDAANNGIGYATVTLRGCRINSISGADRIASGGSETYSANKSYCPDPFYIWVIDPPSIIGSTIITNEDGTAQYTAGYNTGIYKQTLKETLRPNADVSGHIELNPQPGTGEDNYEDVDEETADDNTTYVSRINDTSWKYDYYNIPNPSGECRNHSIKYVKIYFRHDGGEWNQYWDGGYIRPVISNGTDYSSTGHGDDVALTVPWATSNYTWSTNPFTSAAWTWSDIDSLKIGIGLKCAGTVDWWAACTQVYIEVAWDYENVADTIKVIDLNSCCYGESIECAGKAKQVQVESCVVDFNPKDKTIGSGGTIKFNATSNCCEEPTYNWSIKVDAGIGSTISATTIGATGSYRAGRDFTSCSQVTETIEVTDVCSGKKVSNDVTVDACKVTIDPVSPAVDPEETIQFTTVVPLCCFKEPSYSWSLSSGGTTSGGTIDENTGLYSAGPHDGIDIVKVTDNANYKAAHTATVTVGTPPTTTTVGPTTTTTTACVVIIDPTSETVEPLATIQFTATSEFCDNPPSYSWSLSSGGSTSGGTIDNDGLYTAGPHEGTDIVTVTDTANNDVEDTATVNVGTPTTTTVSPSTTTTVGPITTTTVGPITTTTVGPTTTTTAASTTTVVSTTTTTAPTKSIEVLPPEVMRSRWIPLFRLMNIKGTGTNFAIFKTPVEYDSKSVLKLPAWILSPEAIWQLILVMPSLLTGIGFDGESETVEVTVDGVSDTFEIKMLLAPFDKEKNLK